MNTQTKPLTDECIKKIHVIVQAVEAGEADKAARLLDEMTSMREKSLYQELGLLTREFHEALQSFRLDSRIASLAEHDFPDARERLNYVVSMTAQSANSTMTAVEESMPVCESMEERAAALPDGWNRFTNREMGADEFRDLSRRVAEFLDSIGKDTTTLRANLQEVLMAQGFQDLTGQIIYRVVQLVDEVERNLVDLIRISGQSLVVEEKEGKPEDRIAASGPPVPGVDSGTVAGQNEVDDLLSSLGF
ncbi:MAG: protein phosphatase CheZ [Thiohalomonadaceae bacterium]